MRHIVVELHYRDSNGKVHMDSEAFTALVAEPIAITIYDNGERIGFTPLVQDWAEKLNDTENA
jgi:hypothetical protein